MFCGPAAPTLLLVFVAYYILNVCQGWIKERSHKARYSHSKSVGFEWLMKIFLPTAQTKEVTMLIGDNLLSQFSSELLKLLTGILSDLFAYQPTQLTKCNPLM